MNKKVLAIGIIMAVFIVSMYFYLNLGLQCYDGQGFALYIPKQILLDNVVGSLQLDSPDTYVAKIATNPCGKTIIRVIVENGKESRVSQKNFDKYVSDFNNKCDNCLFKVYQSGNSPLFAKEISSDKLFIVENIDGTLNLTPSDFS